MSKISITFLFSFQYLSSYLNHLLIHVLYVFCGILHCIQWNTIPTTMPNPYRCWIVRTHCLIERAQRSTPPTFEPAPVPFIDVCVCVCVHHVVRKSMCKHTQPFSGLSVRAWGRTNNATSWCDDTYTDGCNDFALFTDSEKHSTIHTWCVHATQSTVFACVRRVCAQHISRCQTAASGTANGGRQWEGTRP